MANKGGLNKDGGINFERKRNFSTEKKPYGINTDEPEKEVMTEKEKDANAGVVRDKEGNVMSEVTSG